MINGMEAFDNTGKNDRYERYKGKAFVVGSRNKLKSFYSGRIVGRC